MGQRACLVAADAIVVAVTVYHTYGTVRLARETNINATFSRTLLRAGKSIVPLYDIIRFQS